MLDFYYASGTVALAVHIALEDAGADYRGIGVDFSTTMQRSAEYLKMNPKGRVPVLVTDEGILTETPAMLAYVAQRYPKAKLMPVDDPFAFAQIQAVNSYLCSTLHVAHAHRVRGARWVDAESAIEEMKRKAPQVISECFAYVENELLKGPYVMGDTYTIADPYLFTVAQWMEGDSVDTTKLPKIMAHRAMMMGRNSVKQALAEEAL
ncbi:MAG: glutathione S-transferase family protein [Rhizobiaceae bacterium]